MRKRSSPEKEKILGTTEERETDKAKGTEKVEPIKKSRSSQSSWYSSDSSISLRASSEKVIGKGVTRDNPEDTELEVGAKAFKREDIWWISAKIVLMSTSLVTEEGSCRRFSIQCYKATRWWTKHKWLVADIIKK